MTGEVANNPPGTQPFTSTAAFDGIAISADGTRVVVGVPEDDEPSLLAAVSNEERLGTKNFAECTDDELALLQRAIRLTYTGEISVYELTDSCAESRGGKKR